MILTIYSDGASRGNPGPSATAYLLIDEEGQVLQRHSQYIGIRTNNQAEYEALISALDSASRFTDQEMVCYMDSELVTKQLKGEYKVKNPELNILRHKVKLLEKRFVSITWTHVRRTSVHIQEVDRMVNQVLADISTIL